MLRKEGENMVSAVRCILNLVCHYPLAEWNGYFRGSWHIHGHIHNRRNEAFSFMQTRERALNAGADITQFMPVTFAELKQYNKAFKCSYT
jgi:calcineurin-like phosphoesterase family protein